MKEPVQQSLWPFNNLATSHIRAPRAHSTSLVYNSHHTVNMGKVPLIARQGTRYEPYSNAVLARRRGSSSPDRWGIRAGSRQAKLTDGLFDLLDELKTRYGGHDFRELFRDHANQPGALGQAIGTWIQCDEVTALLASSSFWAVQTRVLLANSSFQIRGRRKLEPTEFVKTQRNDQSHCSYFPGPIPGGERKASRAPVGQPDTCHVRFLHDRKSLMVELNSHYRFPHLVGVLGIRMSLHRMSVCIVFASL